MTKTRFGFLCVLLCLLVQPSLASLSTSDLENITSPGVVQLKCAEPGKSTTRVSLGGVLQSPAVTQGDLVLVVAHGLAGHLEGCKVRWQQQSLSVVSAVRGTREKVGGDWAVLTLSARFVGQVDRFAWRSVDPDDFHPFNKANGKVYLLRHHNGVVGQGCATHVPTRGLSDASDQDTVVVADCLTIPGMSGAPAMVKMDDGPVLVGLSIGQRFDLSRHNFEWKQRATVIRLIDVDVERAILLAQQQSQLQLGL